FAYQKEISNSLIFYSAEYQYSNSLVSGDKEYGSPKRDFVMFVAGTIPDTYIGSGNKTLIFPRRSTKDFRIDPQETDTNGNDYHSIGRMRLAVGLTEAGEEGYDSNTFRLLGVTMLVLNIEALESYAESFVITPVVFPAEISVTEDYGLYYN